MWKKLVVIALSLWAAAAFAAADANKATAAELDAIKGIGPAISAKIIEERKSGAFKDWNDLIAPGVAVMLVAPAQVVAALAGLATTRLVIGPSMTEIPVNDPAETLFR